jgi:predicted metal-binding protein
MAAELSEIKPDVIHFSACMAKAQPPCPYIKAEDMAKLVEAKTGIRVVLGTHDYH